MIDLTQSSGDGSCRVVIVRDLDLAAIGRVASHFGESAESPDASDRPFRPQSPLAMFVFWLLTQKCSHEAWQARETLDRLADRESFGGTGIGWGVAIPHTKSAWVQKTTVCLLGFKGISFDFRAYDGIAVNVVCVVLSPPSASAQQLRVWSTILSAIKRTRDKARAEAVLEAVARALERLDRRHS
jgi:mannitol/fructose-specific phosphotransferase system IIA component (Ntr-type)